MKNTTVKLENVLPEAEAVLQKLNKELNEETDAFTPEQRRAISMLSVAAQLLGWDIAVPLSKNSKIEGIVIGTEDFLSTKFSTPLTII